MQDCAVRVGNGQGFWGDSILGPTQLVSAGGIDYLTMDFLAEVTMSIMRKLRNRRSDAGYATDFVHMVERVLPACQRQGITIVANAGGVNASGSAEACEAIVRKLGLRGVRIGIIEGDDLLGDGAGLEGLIADGEALANLDNGESLAAHLDDVLSVNAYLGAVPIVEALDQGADIVITGRVADVSLTVGPLMHRFGWSLSNLDALAGATVAGHIIECGTQCTGGNLDRWEEVPDLAHIGYPVVEADADGSFVVTKPAGTGGMVTVDTVTAQLLYEIGDPRAYVTPDVVADFTSVRLTQESADRVRVDGVKGTAATPTYKVSAALRHGYQAVGQLVVGGPDAVRKAQFTAGLLFDRLALDGTSFAADQRQVDIIGTNVLFPGMLPASEPTEVVLRVGVSGPERQPVDRFGQELASLLTSGPPGLTGFAGGRPKASEVVAFWPALVAKSRVTPVVTVREIQ